MKKFLILGGALAIILATTATVWACCGPFCVFPVITNASVTPDTLWPPNHKMVGVKVSAKVSWGGAAGTVKIVGISSNEPVNGTGDGDTEPDWQVTGAMTADLRAERAGGGDGRVYTIVIEARQPPPCQAYASYEKVTVEVPHDQGK